jgi:hypothetical protein
MKNFTIITGLLFTIIFNLSAKEGIWIPTLLEKYNIEEMQKMGFKLTAEDIYSVNQESMKDAVVLFGSGCTGGMISADGLLITNHHCGFDAIQYHSSVEHDYLTKGFWAKSRQDELPTPKLAVRFLDRMEDVSDKVLSGTVGVTKDSIEVIINRNSKKISKEASQNGKFEANVQPLFYGNQYFLYVYKVFEDVRLVGAPPSSIGKFGGDTDNWIWPRHTGDFSIFRVYAGKNNQPAKYSAENVPYQPKKFFKISIKGVKEQDFTLVFGFPGRTQQFLPSEAIRQIIEQGDPDKIKIRDRKLSILANDMEKDPKVRIQYAAKYQSTSNAWKKWQGEVKGLKRLNAVEVKEEAEGEFRKWVKAESERKIKYGKVLNRLDSLYNELAPYTKANDYYTEIAGRGTDLFNLTALFDPIIKGIGKLTEEQLAKLRTSLQPKLSEHFKNYNASTDEKVFAELFRLYARDIDPLYLPKSFSELMRKTTSQRLIEKYYRSSIFTDSVRMKNLANHLDAKNAKKLSKDPAYQLFKSLKVFYDSNIEPPFSSISKQIDEQMKIYVAGLLEMNEGENIWADANKTLRVSYGKVEGYQPMDGVDYEYFTTLEGIMQKDNPDIYDYNVPQALRELYKNMDYGRYGHLGQLNVCFTASNHTTGGNSGSPVLNADGNLIGLNFDRCWEGTMSDLLFDPERCRNITLDIRYALFIIDRFAGAGYLLDEMAIEE